MARCTEQEFTSDGGLLARSTYTMKVCSEEQFSDEVPVSLKHKLTL
jgi:hypothetical protein